MAKLMFVRRVPSIKMEKTTPAEKAEMEINPRLIKLVGMILLAFLGVAAVFYLINRPEAGRVVIDITFAFFAWATGRATGEKASVSVGN